MTRFVASSTAFGGGIPLVLKWVGLLIRAVTTTAAEDRPVDPLVHLQATQEGITVEKALVQRSAEMVGLAPHHGHEQHGRNGTLEEPLPSTVDHDDVGLHPERHGENWTPAEDGLEFSTTVGDDVVTMYAVRNLEVVPVTLAHPPQIVRVERRSRSLAR